MLKLYGQYRSRAFRVAWLCKESRIPYEHVNVTINGEGATCKNPDLHRERRRTEHALRDAAPGGVPARSVMKYDLSAYPRFAKWLTESLDRPQAKEARKLRE